MCYDKVYLSDTENSAPQGLTRLISVGQSESTGQKKAVKLLEVTAVAEMVAKDLERRLNN